MGFATVCIVALALTVALAGLRRGRRASIFTFGMFGLLTLSVIGVSPAFGSAAWVLLLGLGLTFGWWLGMLRPRLRSAPWRWGVALPGHVFAAGGLLALPWATAAGAGFHPWWPWLPWAIAGLGLFESVLWRDEVVDIVLDRAPIDGLRRIAAGGVTSDRPLRVVQITDPHLGPFVPVDRLRAICARAVAKDPDLVLLTGDFLTIETNAEADALAQGLAPLAALPGRVFACRGNHDLEAPDVVARALAAAGVVLLIDDARIVETRVGRVQVVGFDFVWRDRAAHLAAVCARHPRVPGALRVAMLHDPGAFRHLAPGEADLVLAGHTHGGHLGLLRLGLPFTFVSVFADLPDHGLWARGADRLYVHRGTGHYGFPVRIGVPAEESLLRVHAAAGQQAS